MLFNSATFLFFAITVMALYYAVPKKGWQLFVLLVSSLVFYGWTQPALLALLGACILMNACTSWLASLQPRKRNQILIAATGVILNLATLCAFKYMHLVAAGLDKAFGVRLGHIEPMALLLQLPLPIGISFYTFEAIALLVDTVRGSMKFRSLRQHMVDTALFISFFPHLIAGPIVRPSYFFDQIGVKYFRAIDWNKAGEYLILGYFLKVFVADNLASMIDSGVAYRYMLSSFDLALTACAFSVRIFADFAGYSYIALGLAALFGYKLPQNFNWPYTAQSLSEFWKRWHISLSTWLRDYLYIPLGGSQQGQVRTYINIMVVMLLGGLWHGAAVNFILWGGMHGLGLCLERSLGWHKITSNNRFIAIARALVIFGFVTFAWLFFSHKAPIALSFCHAMLENFALTPAVPRDVMLIIICFPVLLMHLVDAVKRGTAHIQENPSDSARSLNNSPALLQHISRTVRAVCTSNVAYDCAMAMMLFLTLVNPGDPNTFLYFQF